MLLFLFLGGCFHRFCFLFLCFLESLLIFAFFRGMQAYFALYWWFLTWIVNSRQFTSNAFFFIIFFAQNAYLSILLGFWFFFFNVAHWFLYARVWNKMFWRDKKKFHNPVILFLRFVFLFWAVPFSFFLEFQLFFSFLTFFFGEGVFLGCSCCCCSGWEKDDFFYHT